MSPAISFHFHSVLEQLKETSAKLSAKIYIKTQWCSFQMASEWVLKLGIVAYYCLQCLLDDGESNEVLGNTKHPTKYLQQFWPHQLLPKGFFHLHRLSQPMLFMWCCKETSHITQPMPLQSCSLPLLCTKSCLRQVKQRTYIWYNWYLGSIITIVSNQFQKRKDNGVAKAAHTLFKLLPTS